MVSVTGPTRPSCVRVRRGAPSERGGSSLGLEHLFSRRSLPGVLRSWARAGSHSPAPRPRPSRQGLAFSCLANTAPGHPTPKASAGTHLEANTGLQHPLSTLHEWRHRLPCKTRFRLAGCAFAGRGSNPLGHCERFQVISTSSFPGLLLSQWVSNPIRTDPDASCPPVTKIPSCPACHRSAGGKLRRASTAH